MNHLETFTDDNFADEVDRYEGVTVVDFWAGWCGPCRALGPIIQQLAEDYEGKVKVGKLDVDSNPFTSSRFDVRSIPTVLFFVHGQLVDRAVGLTPRRALEQRLQSLLAAAGAESLAGC